MVFLGGDMHGFFGGACMVFSGGMHGFLGGSCIVFLEGVCMFF